MTTEVYPEPVLAAPLALRAGLAHKVMRGATRIRWAEPELRGLGAVVRRGDSVIDVGAAHGMYTIPFAHLVGPAGRVDSFEPHPRQQGQLRFLRRLLGADHVRVIASAVGAEVGENTMRLPVKYGFPIYGHAHVVDASTALPASDQKIRQWRTPMTTVDSWADQEGIERVSFVKVDVEGFEPNVIAGATRTIENHRPSLLLEIEDRHLGRYDTDGNAFADEIRERWPDYRMYTWASETWTLTPRVDLGVRNYLFATDAAFARG